MEDKTIHLQKIDSDFRQKFQDTGQEFSLQAEGGSMYPILKDGDKLYFQFISSEELRIGDLALFRDSVHAKVIAHRVVTKKKKNAKWYFETKGDASFSRMTDSLIDETSILGRVIAYERDGRRRSVNGGIFNILNPMIAWLSYRLPGGKRFLKFLKNKIITIYE